MNLSNKTFPVPYHPSWEIVDTTKLKTCVECPRKYFYEYVLGWRPTTPSNHLVFGSSVHLALEHLLLNGYDNQCVFDAFDIFLRDYRKTFPPETDELFHPKTPDNFLILLTKYASEYKHELEKSDVLYTEIAGTINIDEDVVLAFRMDSVLRDKRSGNVFSLEHKTGSSTYFWCEQWPLAMQVGTYQHVLNCLFPDDDKSQIVMNGLIMFKVKKAWQKMLNGESIGSLKPPYEFIRYPIRKDNAQMAVWQWNMLYYFNQLNFYFDQLSRASDSDFILETFPLRVDSCTNYGKICSYYDFCCAWPNPLQRCSEPPIGFDISFWNPLEQEAKHEFKL